MGVSLGPTRVTSPGIGSRERLGFGLLGGLLVAAGLRRRSFGGLATAAAGTLLIVRAVSGRPDLPQTLRAATNRAPHTLDLQGSITVGRTADELHRAWRNPQILSRVMGSVVDVTAPSSDVLHWVVSIPGGRAFESETRIVHERPGELLQWESLPGAAFPNEGSIQFALTDRGTEVRLRVRVLTPVGPARQWLERQLGPLPGALIRKVLRRFKSLVETGEIASTERNPSSRRAE